MSDQTEPAHNATQQQSRIRHRLLGIGVGLALCVGACGNSPKLPGQQQPPATSAKSVATSAAPSAPATQTVTVTQPPPSIQTVSVPPPAQSEGTVLAPNANGYVFVETKSGKTRCLIDTNHIACEAAFTNAPIISGQRAHDFGFYARRQH
jgi:hypothetical protein